MPRRSRAAIEDEAEDVGPNSRRQRADQDVDVSDAASDASDDAGGEDASYSSHDQMVKKLVRLALAHEVSRKPIRRQDVADKVLGNAPRAFKRVFADANEKLQKVFGMTMAELPSKEKITTQQKRQAQRAAAQRTGAGSKVNSNYIVTTVLPAQYRRFSILHPIKTPSLDLEAQYTGLYTWVVSVIMLSNNKRISETKLESYLQKMNAGDSVAGDRTDKMLKRMEREGYITKIRERDINEETVDWVLGPRAKMEIGETGVAGMVRTVYGVRDHELRDLENKLENSLGEGTFKRKTAKDGPDIHEDEDGADEADGDTIQLDRTDSRIPEHSAPRRSTRQSPPNEDGAEEEEEEEEDAEEEEEDEDE